MDINSIFAKLKNVLQMGAGASLAIGNPVKVGDLSIIPVAKIAFGFGGGAGSSAGKAKKTEKDKQQDAVATNSHQDDVATLEESNSHQDDMATMKESNSHQDDVATLKATMEATMKDTAAEANVGGGGGGGIKTDPIGIYAIHGDKVKFYPVISIKEIATLAGLILLFSYRFARLRWRKK